jgi:serine/threonine-protein kinase
MEQITKGRRSLDETIANLPSGAIPIGGSAKSDLLDGMFVEAEDSLVGRFLGQYFIEASLGEGSIARVYRARHLGLKRVSALKIIDSSVNATPESRDQFWAEARAAANLVHPHVVTVHNLGTEEGFDYIEMEYIHEGTSLRESIVKDGPIEPTRASVLVRQVVLALGEAHRSGLVHRDVKPANVLLTPQGEAKLADFGLVRHLDDLAGAGTPIAGTPTYMAPELFRGTPASPGSDLYAVGVMYYYLLSGRLPYSADNIRQLIAQHQSWPIPNIREHVEDIPQLVVNVLERALAKSPGDRYASAEELAEDLLIAIHRLRDTETLVNESVKGLDCFVQGARDLFRIIFPLPGDRLQEVLVEGNEGKNQDPYLSVFSVCAPADPMYFEYALKLNARLTYGSLSIRDVLGVPMFVMSRTFARDRVRTEDIRDALVEISRRADRIEQQLTQLDQY